MAIFHAITASSLIDHETQALDGGNVYRIGTDFDFLAQRNDRHGL